MPRPDRLSWLALVGLAGCVAGPRPIDAPPVPSREPPARVALPEPAATPPIPLPPAIDPADVWPLHQMCLADSQCPDLVRVAAHVTANPAAESVPGTVRDWPGDPVELADHLDRLRHDIETVEPKAELRIGAVRVLGRVHGDCTPGDLIEIRFRLQNLGRAGRATAHLTWANGETVHVTAPAAECLAGEWAVSVVVPELPPGQQDVTVRVVDAATGRAAVRTGRLVVGRRLNPYH